MKNNTLIVALALLGSFLASDSARAYHGAGSSLGFLPYGFYQPYGIRYSTSVRTPPYFALNPPVYYGSRYARPYGASPFASPPLLTAPPSYQTRLASEFVRPVAPPVGPQLCNPYVNELPAPEPNAGDADATPLPDQDDTAAGFAESIRFTAAARGPVRFNPLASVDGVAGEPRRPLTR